MKNTDTTTNLTAQLSEPVLNFLPGWEVYRGKFENGRRLVSYDSDTNLGVVELPFTGLRQAFRVKRQGRPVAARGFVAEFELELFAIETAARGDELVAELGDKVAGKWLVRAEAIEPTL